MNVNAEMDPLDFLSNEELMRFFHCKKTEMSCMEEPLIFLNQLRDHNLVPEKLYEKVIRMKSKQKRKDGVYQILNWVEKERSSFVKLFWECVFRDHILQQYPVLRMLKNSLLDGSFKFYEKLPNPRKENEKEKDLVQSNERITKGKTKGTKRKKSVEETEDEQPGPSCLSTPSQKNPSKKLAFSSPVKRGQKQEIWTWPLYKSQLPITCGDKTGTLYRDKLPKGGVCILSEGKWFTPGGFEKFAGKERYKNWKVSIRCQKTPLLKLIEDGHLQPSHTKRRCVQKSKKDVSSESSSPSSDSSTEGSDGQEQEEQFGGDDDVGEEEGTEEGEMVDMSVFKATSLPVSCGSVNGVLYKDRFATGTRSKSIRTEERWFTPEEFVKEESTLVDAHWKKDIECYGKTFSYLIKKKMLLPHSLLCECFLCNLEEEDQLNQVNDDMCYMCNTEGKLVCCEECPRSFHYNCHIPAVVNEMLRSTWICTFCVWKTNQRLWSTGHMTQEEALSSPISQYTLQCEYLLLSMYKEDAGRIFTENPCITVPGYTNMISQPMWLDRVRIRLTNNKYNTVGQLVSDVRLIFQNCHVYNRGNEFGVLGSRLSEVFEREFHAVFNIH